MSNMSHQADSARGPRGCEQCRTAKKKCTLEQPSCARCLRQDKQCSGSQNTQDLRIRDQTLAVTKKYAAKKKGQLSPALASCSSQPKTLLPMNAMPQANRVLKMDITAPSFQQTPNDLNLDFSLGGTSSTSSSYWALESDAATNLANADSLSNRITGNYSYDGDDDHAENALLSHTSQKPHGLPLDFGHHNLSVSDMITPKPEDLATNYFLRHFAFQNGQFEHVIKYASQPEKAPSLTLAIQACGMAALSNIHYMPRAGTWTRDMYGKALKLVNSSLHDEKRSTTDESLIAVNMLSFYENLMSDGVQSIQYWQWHIEGAAQLLKLRGRAQFHTTVGRALFRETRNQIIIRCLWHSLEPPAFCKDWTPSLQALSTNLEFIRPADEILMIAFDLAKLRNQITSNQIPDRVAMEMLNGIVVRLDQWPMTTSCADERWQYLDLHVDDSPHVWNGMVHAYTGLPVPSVWNSHRSLRIVVTNARQRLSLRLPNPDGAQGLQESQFRAIKRQMTSDICATIPCQLGHAYPAYNSPHVLVTAYNTIWPLLLAAQCAMEQFGECSRKREALASDGSERLCDSFSEAEAQMLWIFGRFDYISHSVGLRWANSLLHTLPGYAKIRGNAPRSSYAGESVGWAPPIATGSKRNS